MFEPPPPYPGQNTASDAATTPVAPDIPAPTAPTAHDRFILLCQKRYQGLLQNEQDVRHYYQHAVFNRLAESTPRPTGRPRRLRASAAYDTKLSIDKIRQQYSDVLQLLSHLSSSFYHELDQLLDENPDAVPCVLAVHLDFLNEAQQHIRKVPASHFD
jgi:hypothetical protein